MSENTKKTAPESKQSTKKTAKNEGDKEQAGKKSSSDVATTEGNKPQAEIEEGKATVKKAGPRGRSKRSTPAMEESLSEKAAAEKSARKEAKERKKAIKSLRLSDAKARKLLNVIYVGIAFHDLVRNDSGKPVDYRIREVNPAFEATLELAAAATIGSLASKVYGKRGRAPFLKDIVEAMETGDTRIFEGTVRSTQGRLRFSVQPMEQDLFALLIEDASEEARARRRRAFLETRLKTLTGERKEALTALAGAQTETRELKRQVKSLEKARDAALREVASRSAALERETVKLANECGKRERLEAALAAAAEVRDNLKSITGNLSKVLRVK